ncbi:MAG: imelysin family protein [Bacteroidota bacterium]|nr:imelysin family protein [Bacteroidota bacterium]
MKKLLLLFIISFLFISCSKDDSTEIDIDPQAFDREALMRNLTDNIIIPVYENFDSKLSILNSDLQSFNSNVSIENLEKLRQSFIDSYKSWQYVEMFNIGKAEEIYYHLKINVYPVNVARVQNNMSSTSLDLDDCSSNKPNNCSAQGLPTVDFLLYGIAENDSGIVELFGAENSSYLSYLNLVISKIISNTSLIINDWLDTKESFISSFQNNSSSSLNMLANDFVYYYEKGFRANKIGIPAGRFSGKLPQNVEAYYSQIYSKDYSLEALKAVENFFLGKSFGTEIDGTSFKDYIDYLDTEKTLSNLVLQSFESSLNKIQLLDNNFSHQVNTDNVKMLEAYDAIQQGVVYLKTDMLSLMSISVDYMDADGD